MKILPKNKPINYIESSSSSSSKCCYFILDVVRQWLCFFIYKCLKLRNFYQVTISTISTRFLFFLLFLVV